MAVLTCRCCRYLTHSTLESHEEKVTCVVQDGVELGVYIREAMEEAGKPFGELSPEQITAALRKYEIERSHRVAHIVGKSGNIGSMFMLMGYLVSACLELLVDSCLEQGGCMPL